MGKTLRKTRDDERPADGQSLGAFRPTPAPILPVDDMSAGVRAERAHSSGVRVTSLGNAGHGRCEYNREGKAGGYRVARLVLPAQGDARGRVIRGHELLHARYSPARRRSDSRFLHDVTNTAEDCHIHCNGWPRVSLGHLTRDACAVALADLRAVARAERAGELEDIENHNRGVAVLVRSLAILRGAAKGAHGTAHASAARLAAARATALVGAVFGPRVVKHVSQAVLLQIERDTGKAHTAACEAIDTLMRHEDPDPDAQREADEGSPVDRDGAPIEEDDREIEKGDKGKGDNGESATTNPMAISCLPLLDACSPQTTGRGRSRTGARINGSRLAQAVASANPAGLFIRTRRVAGGSVCIDASGSMHFTAETLAALCLDAPSATVGYYSGGGKNRSGQYGELRIFARGGKRSRTAPRQGGSNEVDLWALRWLLRQPAPRVLVSDLGFCGGPAGQSEAAHIECERAVRSGMIHLAGDVEEAHGIFRALRAGQQPEPTETHKRCAAGMRA